MYIGELFIRLCENIIELLDAELEFTLNRNYFNFGNSLFITFYTTAT